MNLEMGFVGTFNLGSVKMYMAESFYKEFSGWGCPECRYFCYDVAAVARKSAAISQFYSAPPGSDCSTLHTGAPGTEGISDEKTSAGFWIILIY